MAKEKISRTICDRCARVMEEIDTGNAAATEGTPPKYYVEVDGAKALAFEDLCKKCDDRIASLLEDMKLEKPEGGKKKTAKEKAAAKKEAAAKKAGKGKDSKKDEQAATAEAPVN